MKEFQFLRRLHPDLITYVVDHPFFGQAIDHPLVTLLPLTCSQAVNIVNASYTWSKAALSRALEADDWERFIFLHQRPYRFDALLQALEWNDGEPAGLWPLVGRVWSDSENIRHHQAEWREIWSSECPRRRSVMDRDDRDRLRKLPSELTVWRGVAHCDAARGLSWTLDRNTAVWFAHRNATKDGPRFLVQGCVSKSAVRAYFGGRQESEIVIFPEQVSAIQVEPLQAEDRLTRTTTPRHYEYKGNHNGVAVGKAQCAHG